MESGSISVELHGDSGLMSVFKAKAASSTVPAKTLKKFGGGFHCGDYIKARIIKFGGWHTSDGAATITGGGVDSKHPGRLVGQVS